MVRLRVAAPFLRPRCRFTLAPLLLPTHVRVPLGNNCAFPILQHTREYLHQTRFG